MRDIGLAPPKLPAVTIGATTYVVNGHASGAQVIKRSIFSMLQNMPAGPSGPAEKRVLFEARLPPLFCTALFCPARGYELRGRRSANHCQTPRSAPGTPSRTNSLVAGVSHTPTIAQRYIYRWSSCGDGINRFSSIARCLRFAENVPARPRPPLG